MVTAQQVSFCFFWDEHLWWQVWRTLLQYFQRFYLFSMSQTWPFLSCTIQKHHYLSLKQKKIIQKGKRHSSLFQKAFQISRNYFSFGTLITAVFSHTSLIFKGQSCHSSKNNCDRSNYDWIVPSQYPLAVKQQLLHNL